MAYVPEIQLEHDKALTTEQAMAEVAKEYGIHVTLVSEHQLGQAWPKVRIEGSVSELENALIGRWSYDRDELDYNAGLTMEEDGTGPLIVT